MLSFITVCLQNKITTKQKIQIYYDFLLIMEVDNLSF